MTEWELRGEGEQSVAIGHYTMRCANCPKWNSSDIKKKKAETGVGLEMSRIERERLEGGDSLCDKTSTKILFSC